tara:strand:- start:1407 stop:1868 length:462 start_codon:yes stop_codon:yes gene_type:complete
MTKQNLLLEWTGYTTDEEVKAEMEAYNADEVGLKNPITFEEMETQMANGDYYYYAWEDFTEYLTELMNKKTYWRDDAKNMGWQNRSGYKVFEADNGSDFIKAISPDTDCVYQIYKHYNGFKIRISHHDAPMGEHHVVKPITEKAYSREEIELV